MKKTKNTFINFMFEMFCFLFKTFVKNIIFKIKIHFGTIKTVQLKHFSKDILNSKIKV